MNGGQVRVQRLFTIVRLLSSPTRGMTLNEICKAISQSERTVYRYLRALRNLGFSLETIYTGGEALYKIEKNKSSVSEIFEYLPELTYRGQVLIPPEHAEVRRKPVWIYKGRGADEYFVFDSLRVLLKQFDISESIDAIYRKLRKNSVAIYPNYRIIRAPYYRTTRKSP